MGFMAGVRRGCWMLDWLCAGNIILQRALGYGAGLVGRISGPSASLRATYFESSETCEA